MYLWLLLTPPLLTLASSWFFRKKQDLFNLFACINSFLLLTIALAALLSIPEAPYHQNLLLFDFAKIHLAVELYYDHLSAIMLILVSFVYFMIQLYSARYLLSDETQVRFTAQLSALVAASCLLMISGNLFTSFIAWQWIGLCLYLLLNHYHYDYKANKAAKKKFIINRIGDVCFLLAILCAFNSYGDISYSSLLNSSNIINNSGHPSALILGLVFVAVMTKAAQFPFHLWLPDTMQAPTPVSAIMHAGVINAGGFLLARLSPWLSLHSQILNFIFSIGLITALFASLCMLTQADIKKRLAYSTMGQMGYMILQCGLGCFSTAVFHLIAHGFYKATLFLETGSGLNCKVKKSIIQSPFSFHSYLNLSLSLFVSSITLALMFLVLKLIKLENALHPISWLFLGITLMTLSYHLTKTLSPVRFKILSFIIISIAALTYLIALGHFDSWLKSNLVSPINSNPAAYATLVVALLASLFIFLNLPSSSLKNYFYKLSLSKGNLESYYRQYLLYPTRFLGEFVCKFIQNKMSLALSLGVLISVLGCLNILKLFNPQLHTLVEGSLEITNFVVLSSLLLAANRAQSLKKIICYLVIAQICLAGFVFIIEAQHWLELSIYQITNTLLIGAGCWKLLQEKPATAKTTELHNKLPYRSIYLSIFLMLLIGIPGTASFVSEILVLNLLLNDSFIFAFAVGLTLILLALAVLHSLQQYIFNQNSASALKNHITLKQHLFLALIIAINFANGIQPQLSLNFINTIIGSFI